MSVTARKRRQPVLADAYPMWRARIAAHEVGRWHVPERIIELGSPSAELAVRFAVEHAHIAAGVPPWRPLRRESLRHVTAQAIGERAA